MSQDGYISEINYIHGYFSELSPTRLKLALLSKGIAHSMSQTPSYLELGFGQGLSLMINAATGSGHYYGTDFNPSQVAHAVELAAAVDKDISLFDAGFEELLAGHELPEFDIIALHGIWSWVSPETRAAIVDIVKRKLKPGGVLYISYNVTPGWSPAVPLRHLMAEYAKTTATGGILDRVKQSIGFVEQVIGANALYFQANPALAELLKQIKNQDINYVAHEYFNGTWDPMPFSQISQVLAGAKVNFAASANLMDNLEAVSMPEAARPIINALHDTNLRETTKDYFINQRFRRDIFVKGPRQMSAYEIGKAIEEIGFYLIGDPKARPKTVPTSIGSADLRDAIHDPIAEAMASFKGRAVTIPEILSHKACKGITKWQVWEAMLVQTVVGFVAPACESDTPEEDLASSKRLNALICAKAAYSGNMAFLAAPRIGTAIAVNRVEQLFIHAASKAIKDPPAYVWGILSEQNQKLIMDGKTLETAEENIAQLRQMFDVFNKARRQMLSDVGAI